MAIEMILALLAGLGLFLYGMKLMSDGLQKVAGAKLRTVLEKLTKNPIMGVVVGFVFTAIVQSSSATTVLVVSFVDTGLINLSQSVGVILGANVGTTITGQLIAFKLTAIAPIILMIGVMMLMFFKKPMVQKSGEVCLGFGMLFFGLSTMSDSMQGMSDSLTHVLSSMDNIYLAVLVGFIVTAILQSSSATTGIVMVLAGQHLVTLQMSFYLILGCNVGSCVSALIACIPGNKNAKRAAMVHFVFNIIGTALVILTLGLLEPQIETMIRSINSDPMSCVANANTIFKLAQVLILLPFSKWLVRLAELIIPGEDKVTATTEFQLEFIGGGHAVTPASAVPNAISEIMRMGHLANDNLHRAMNALLQNDKKAISTVYENEKEIDYLNTEISNYLVQANQLSLPMQDKKLLGGLFHVVNDMERIGDHAENIADFATTCQKEDLSFSKDAKKELQKMLDRVDHLLAMSLEMFGENKDSHMKEILTLENEIDTMERKLQKRHVKRLTSNKCEPHAAMIYTDLLSNLERVADHGTNIAFSIIDDVEDEEE